MRKNGIKLRSKVTNFGTHAGQFYIIFGLAVPNLGQKYQTYLKFGTKFGTFTCSKKGIFWVKNGYFCSKTPIFILFYTIFIEK